jgi:hypothetical protein
MHLRLLRQVAEDVSGIDLSRCRVGEILVVSPRSASALLAGGYATEIQEPAISTPAASRPPSLLEHYR